MNSKNKRQKNVRREQSPLSKILSSSSNQGKVLEKFFSELPANYIKSSVKSLAKHRHFSNAIELTRHSLGNCYSLMSPSSDIKRNIGWCLGLMEYHAKEIQFFIDQQDSLLENLFFQNYDEVLTILDHIDERCGISIWTISVRGTIMSMAGMTEQKRSMLLRMNEVAKGNPFLKAVIRRVTERFDYGDVVSTETKFFEQKIKRQFEGETLHFLMYKLIPNNFDFEYDYHHILNYEKNTSPVDIYQCLMDFVCHSMLANGPLAYKDEASWVIRVLNGFLVEQSLTALAHSIGIDIAPILVEEEYQILDGYTSGQYSRVCEIMEIAPELTKNFGLYELWAKAACRYEGNVPDNLLGKLIAAMTSVMLKDSTFDEAQLFLASHTHALSVLPWFRQLRYLTVLETRFIAPDKNDRLKAMSVAISQLYSPLKANFLETEQREKYMAELRRRFPDSSSVALFNACTDASTTDFSENTLLVVDPLRKKKYRAEWFADQGKHYEAIDDLISIVENSDVVISHDATRLLVSSYIATDQVEKAVETYVAAVIKNPSLLLTFDSHAICTAGEKVISTSKSISLPVAFSLHSKFFDDSHAAALKFSFECFLRNNGASTPLELAARDVLPEAQYHYFLEHVSVPEVMKLYLYFERTKDIELCRIDICKHLVQENISTDSMIYEIKERTKRLVIMDAIKHVENSRIYSDTSSFNLPSASIEYRQLFDRFSNLRGNDYSASEDEQELQKFFNSAAKDPVLLSHLYIVHVQDLVLNEKNAIFMKLIKLMRDEFTFGVKGLNGHLSTRIRHGYFPNTLRKCLAEENLITAKLATAGTYKRNAYWIDHFSDIHRSKATEIERTFTEFASKFDSLINEVNDQWLKIGTLDQDISGLIDGKVKQTTLFNYSVTALESYFIQTRLAPTAEYSDLSKVVTTWLWERTEANLNIIRARLSKEVRERVHDLLKKLESDIYSILGDSVAVSAFSDAVSRARARFNTAFETIVGWFTRSQEQTIASFESDIPLEIAKLSAGAEIDIFEDTTYVKFSGKALSYVVDILYVLLENCISKSNLPKEEIKISVRLFWEDQSFVLQVINNCLLSEGKDFANRNLQHYRDNYGKEKYAVQASQGEGKSGFFKVWKALSKDLDLSHSTSFEYLDDSTFKVSLRVDRNEIKKILI